MVIQKASHSDDGVDKFSDYVCMKEHNQICCVTSTMEMCFNGRIRVTCKELPMKIG